MENKINFELVSPEEKLIEAPVSMAVIPAQEGEMGVGAGHSAYVVALKAGVVRLYHDKKPNEGGQDEKIFIAGGFADITGQGCVVLAEEAINVNDIDQAAIEQSLKDLAEDLDMAKDAADKPRIQKKIDIARAKLSAVTGTVA